MAISSIFADFTIRDNEKADAFADACERSLATPRKKIKHKALLVNDKEQLDALFEKLKQKYGCLSK